MLLYIFILLIYGIVGRRACVLASEFFWSKLCWRWHLDAGGVARGQCGSSGGGA